MPSARLYTARVEKSKTYTRNLWTGLGQKLTISGMGEYMNHFLKTFFHTKYYFASYVLFSPSWSRLFFFQIARSDSFNRWPVTLLMRIMCEDNELFVSSEDISDQRNDQQIGNGITPCLARTAIPLHHYSQVHSD